ncbi:hypothetical protein ZPR_0798 [Zunongwangia profunda SM-A87]|uniref:Uncharacterized protein n=1 Tax=Zunongwangia profunda (strain DSM 18752 / CCTCC AB 206139 / SM-A87) TaxID=655815 RepID=D5BGI9_ZUNPS|nr:hypothetical protein ZPR_0798 [Zunongwangia profunda SM-A87]
MPVFGYLFLNSGNKVSRFHIQIAIKNFEITFNPFVISTEG